MAGDTRDLRERLEATGLVGTCEACGVRAKWTLADDEYVLPVAGGGKQAQMSLYAMVCGNCGHVRLFNANVL